MERSNILDNDVITRRKADIKVFGRLGEVMDGQLGEREGGEENLAISSVQIRKCCVLDCL